jgi:glycosyltransferase involved in cell wall biosynthesis
MFNVVGRYALRQADGIIAVSQSTKRDLIKYLRIKPEKIIVAYAGFDSDLFRFQREPNEISEVKKKYGIDQQYILFAATLEPRKNLTRLLDAFALLQKRGWTRHKLVVTGKKGWLYRNIFHKIRELELEREVIFTGYVPRQDLAGLMAGADVFVYPSLYEGFGIPPLEAMACGTPVIVSNTSSLPEVVGDAGVQVNPYSPAQIADAIYQITSEDAIRQAMRKDSLEQAKKFSWEKTAEDCVSLFERMGRQS